MWYFLVRQNTIDVVQYRALQKQSSLTEVENFNEPYENWYLFSVEKGAYMAFVDQLDREGISYDLVADRPTRDEILERMR